VLFIISKKDITRQATGLESFCASGGFTKGESEGELARSLSRKW
jgi:hypothetical protein